MLIQMSKSVVFKSPSELSKWLQENQPIETELMIKVNQGQTGIRSNQ